MPDENIPELTLDPETPFAPLTPIAVQKPEPVAAQPFDESRLSEAERKAITEFAEKIDIKDSNVVLNYGAAAQKHVSAFSDSALQSVRTKDLGAVGDSLSGLVSEMRGFRIEEPKKGLAGMFQRSKNKLEAWRTGYAKAESNIDEITGILEGHQVSLMKDVAMLDQMYALNLQYYKELTMYIMAGRKRLEAVRAGDLTAAKAKAEATGLPEDAQAYNDMANLCNRFEKKIHDLELTRVICIQMAPQTRMLQNNDAVMVEKIQSSLVNTIPLWKSQMVLALGLEHSRQATEAQRQVTDMTNELLKQNADMLRVGTTSTAREAERSIIDIQTLQHTNEQLIATLDEVLQIQKEGQESRAAAEVELRRIEGELKQKLLELRG